MFGNVVERQYKTKRGKAKSYPVNIKYFGAVKHSFIK